MGKLGKNARKFAKKNLQSVHKRQRKMKIMFKKKAPSKKNKDDVDNQKDDASKLQNRMIGEVDENKNVSLDAIFNDYSPLHEFKDYGVEFCSFDVHRSSTRAKVSIQQLSKILQQGLRTKKKEAVKMMCSWQFISCIDLWVKFIAANFHDYDLQTLLYNVIQIVNVVAALFPGPRYIPLRIKCIQWLNSLSSSSGTFIPVASMVLDILENITGKEGKSPGVALNHLSALQKLFMQLPKNWLKSQKFVEECVLSSIELLSTHFAQWSYNISFPELATIPIAQLKKFHATTTTTDNLKRLVKRFIDQVEQNIDFVQKKRDEASFSLNDQQAVESFLQLEKCNNNVSFIQYYKSILDKAASRNLALDKKFPGPNKNKKKRQQLENDPIELGANGKVHPEKKRAKKTKT